MGLNQGPEQSLRVPFSFKPASDPPHRGRLSNDAFCLHICILLILPSPDSSRQRAGCFGVVLTNLTWTDGVRYLQIGTVRLSAGCKQALRDHFYFTHPFYLDIWVFVMLRRTSSRIWYILGRPSPTLTVFERSLSCRTSNPAALSSLPILFLVSV